MVLLLFALDLRSLSPPLLLQLKQCLLQLANLYALSDPTLNYRNFDSSSLEDCVGLCYLQRSENSSSDEVKIAYAPRGRGFSLRDFHYAVNHLPSDAYLPLLLDDSGPFLFRDVDFSHLLSDELLYCTGRKDIERKIILISSCLVGNLDFNVKKMLLDVADRCVSVEFVFLEQKSSQLSDISENIAKFRGQICDLENCSFIAYLPDVQVFNGLVKRWIQELKDNEEVLQVHFVFPSSTDGSVNRISCKLCYSINHIMDGFSPHKVIKHDTRTDNTGKNSKKVDEHTSATEASLGSWTSLCSVSSAVDLNVIERTSLASLSEGVVVGRPYIVIPSVGQDTDTAPEESEKSQLNTRFFDGLCHALCSLNQGLVCRSFCNIDTMTETAFYYYYILQPSDNGPMLLRRLAGAEEILPFPDIDVSDASPDDEIDKTIQQCLREVELRDYNPVLHSGGFHEKFNKLVEESSQSRLENSEVATTPSDPTPYDGVSLQPVLVTEFAANQGGTHSSTLKSSESITPAFNPAFCDIELSLQPTPVTDVAAPQGGDNSSNQAEESAKGVSHLAQEWEQLIVGDVPRIDLASPKLNLDMLKTSSPPPAALHKPLDTRTSKILERLGNPKQVKNKVTTSPTVVSIVATNAADRITDNCLPGLIDNANQGSMTSSQLMKPTFHHRLKRKQR